MSHAATGGGPLWKFSSLGIRIDGWRLTYHRSFDVAAFCELLDTPPDWSTETPSWSFAVPTMWRAIVAPKGLPEDVHSKLEAAVEKAYNSEEYRDFMTGRGFGMRWAGSEEATKVIAQDDENLGMVMKEAGLAKQ